MRAARGVVTALGVDYGTRRAGIAVSVGGASPRPVAVVPATPPGELIDAVVRAAVRERADVIVVGLPKPPRDFEAERAEARRRELYSALVDVGDLANECFDASDVAESLGADEMKRRLGAYSMKIGGRVEERAARLWALVEAGGDPGPRPGGRVRGGRGGQERRVREGEEREGSSRRVGARETTTGGRQQRGGRQRRGWFTTEQAYRRRQVNERQRRSRCTSSRVDSPRTSRMRFATRVSERMKDTFGW